MEMDVAERKKKEGTQIRMEEEQQLKVREEKMRREREEQRLFETGFRWRSFQVRDF
jgi:hypothetical protein